MEMKVFDQQMLDELVQKAQASPRRRANLNVHADLHEPVQRLFIAIEPQSYVQPHRHPEAEKWEFFWLVRGRIAALFFDESGEVKRRVELDLAGPVFGFEVPPNTWHTVIALEPGSIFMEVKQGPYTQLSDKDFAAWAPKEGEAGCEAAWQWFCRAQAGDRLPVC